MSTKTTFKRIALVAVASLGFGVLTSVAPANATAVTLAASSLTAGTSSPSRIGAISTTVVTINHTAITAANVGSIQASAVITSAPATSRVRVDTNTSTLGVTLAAVAGSSTVATPVAQVSGNSITVTDAQTVATSSTSFELDFVADVAGSYTVLVSVGAGNVFAAGDRSVALTITTAGAPTAMKVASIAGAVVEGGTQGQLIGVTLTDANGNPTVLTDFEGINVTTLDTTVAISNPALAKGEDTAGTYIIRLTDGGTVATGSAVISFAGTGLLPATLSTNMSATKIGAIAVAAPIVNCTTSANCPGTTANTAAGALAANVAGATSLTVTGVSNATAAATTHLVAVTDSSSGTAVTYDTFVTVAAGTAATPTITTSITAPAPTADGTVVLNFVGGTTSSAATLTYVAPAAANLAVQGQAAVLSATGGVNSFTALVTNQYGTAVANVPVSVSVAGRNTVATRVLGVTDANGLIRYTLTDAGTTGTRDTVTFTATVSAQVASANIATITYGTVVVDKVVVTGGSTAETVAGSVVTAINAANNGPETSRVAITATVTDANGNLLAGVPVTFTVSSGLVYKTAAVDFATVFTGSNGAAVTHVFDWVVGKQTITATAGGKSATGHINWAATTATSARVLSAVATGDIVSLKVVDRFGNGVSGVEINLSRTGAGLFGNGASTQNITTDKNGTADVRFTGSGTVVAELAATYAQAYATAGNITTTAATAAVAGTTAGTGNTLTPAGVAKVSLEIAAGASVAETNSQAAADAAAEATDAANAATDAANAAAEAADAATAAAQDAADAVAALAASVSEMVNALKKQITSLTNLVIKIQKKVKA
jgi:trimeric autotransporter adhesin